MNIFVEIALAFPVKSCYAALIQAGDETLTRAERITNFQGKDAMLRSIDIPAFVPVLLLLSVAASSRADEPSERGTRQVPDRIPLIVDEPKPKAKPQSIVRVKVESAQPNGVEAFDAMMTAARAEYAKINDYTAILIREERMNGELLPPQVVELRFRKTPLSINTRVVSPKELRGEETNFLSTKSDHKVMFKPGGLVEQFYWELPLDDPKVLQQTHHPITDVGINAMLDHVATIVNDERRMKHPVEIYVSNSTYDGTACQRFEIITRRPHPGRYADRSLLYINKESKLPIRYEAYTKPEIGTARTENLLETQSLIELKTNVRLGNATFQR